jgi:hypothetical protein
MLLFCPSRTGSFEFNQNFFLPIEAGRQLAIPTRGNCINGSTVIVAIELASAHLGVNLIR